MRRTGRQVPVFRERLAAGGCPAWAGSLAGRDKGMVKKPPQPPICSCLFPWQPVPAHQDRQGVTLHMHLLPPSQPAFPQEHRYPYPQRLTEVPRNVQRGRTVLPSHSAGMGGSGSEWHHRRGRLGLWKQWGEHTRRSGYRATAATVKALLFLPPQATLWSSPPEAAPASRERLHFPRREH